MPTVRLSKIASGDLRRLRKFLFDKDRDAANRSTEVITDHLFRLRASPHLGSPYGNFKKLVIPFGQSSYLAFYHYYEAANLILVTRIFHGRENVDLDPPDH